MHISDAVKWGLYDRLLAWAAFVVGAGIVAGGLWVGAGNTLGALSGIFVGESVPSPRSLPITVGGVVLGLFVWQLGAVIARYHSLTTATGQEVTDEFDTERVKSEILTVVDDRISEMEHEITRLRGHIETRRADNDGEFSFENELNEASEDD